jgi:hypothetical protein
MKKMIVLAIMVVLLASSVSSGADWRFLSESDSSVLYYDAQSITHPSKNMFRVWIKHEGRVEKWSFMKTLREIDCLEKKYRILSSALYNEKGEETGSSESPSKWRFITPGESSEIVYKMVCGEK